MSIHELHMHLNASPTRVQQIQNKTAKNPTLSSLKSFISWGWPDKRSDCPSHLHGYWNYRDKLAVGLILKGTNIIIPKSLQPDVLQKLHYAHQGAEKCKLRAKGSVIWASINADIENIVKGCSPCQHNQCMNVLNLVTHLSQTCSFETMILISWYLIIIASFLWCVSFEISSPYCYCTSKVHL